MDAGWGEGALAVAPLAMKRLEIRVKTHLVLPGPRLALRLPGCPLDSRLRVELSRGLKTLLRVLAREMSIMVGFHLSALRKELKIQPRRNGSLDLQVLLRVKMGLDRARTRPLNSRMVNFGSRVSSLLPLSSFIRLSSRMVKDPMVFSSHRNLGNLPRSNLVNLTGSSLLPLSGYLPRSSSSLLVNSTCSLLSSPFASLSSLRRDSAPKTPPLPSMTA